MRYGSDTSDGAGHAKRVSVSVCIVTYNQEKYIERCLRSAVEQETDFDFEVIVGDDCSSDSTRQIIDSYVEKYPNIIRKVFHSDNVGAAQNYTLIHRMAVGDYVAHVDGDDFLLPGKLQWQKDFLDRNSHVAVVHKLQIVNVSGTPVGRFWPARFDNMVYDMERLLSRHPAFGNSSVMYRRGLLDPLFEEDMPGYLDFDVYIELAKRGEIGVIDAVLGGYTESVGVSTFGNLYKYAIRSIDRLDDMDYRSQLLAKARARQYWLFARKSFREKDFRLFNTLISSSFSCALINPSQLTFYTFKRAPRALFFVHNLLRKLKSTLLR